MNGEAEKLPELAQAIAARLARVEDLVDAISVEVQAIECAWADYANAAPLGLRRKDLGGNPLRFAGQAQALIVDRLRLVLKDGERMFPQHVPSTQSLADVGRQLASVIDEAVAYHERQHRERAAS